MKHKIDLTNVSTLSREEYVLLRCGPEAEVLSPMRGIVELRSVVIIAMSAQLVTIRIYWLSRVFQWLSYSIEQGSSSF